MILLFHQWAFAWTVEGRGKFATSIPQVVTKVFAFGSEATGPLFYLDSTQCESDTYASFLAKRGYDWNLIPVRTNKKILSGNLSGIYFYSYDDIYELNLYRGRDVSTITMETNSTEGMISSRLPLAVSAKDQQNALILMRNTNREDQLSRIGIYNLNLETGETTLVDKGQIIENGDVRLYHGFVNEDAKFPLLAYKLSKGKVHSLFVTKMQSGSWMTELVGSSPEPILFVHTSANVISWVTQVDGDSVRILQKDLLSKDMFQTQIDDVVVESSYFGAKESLSFFAQSHSNKNLLRVYNKKNTTWALTKEVTSPNQQIDSLLILDNKLLALSLGIAKPHVPTLYTLEAEVWKFETLPEIKHTRAPKIGGQSSIVDTGNDWLGLENLSYSSLNTDFCHTTLKTWRITSDGQKDDPQGFSPNFYFRTLAAEYIDGNLYSVNVIYRESNSVISLWKASKDFSKWTTIKDFDFKSEGMAHLRASLDKKELCLLTKDNLNVKLFCSANEFQTYEVSTFETKSNSFDVISFIQRESAWEVALSHARGGLEVLKFKNGKWSAKSYFDSLGECRTFGTAQDKELYILVGCGRTKLVFRVTGDLDLIEDTAYYQYDNAGVVQGILRSQEKTFFVASEKESTRVFSADPNDLTREIVHLKFPIEQGYFSFFPDLSAFAVTRSDHQEYYWIRND